ncbi:MAG: hypothetical protein JW965_05300 [Bacteroidales bacterium]|nr:hypothetical protein [Bacteroidales bacterium]
MFRKLLYIVIAIILLFTTSGISISKHFCGDNLQSVTLMNIPDPCCDSGSCCHTETQFFKLEGDLTIASIEYFKISLIPVFFREVREETIIKAVIPEALNNNWENIHPPGGREHLPMLQSFLL